MTARSARARIAAFKADAAVVFGSGLAGLPLGARVVDELGYAELGWPVTVVPGHANVLRLVRVPADGDAAPGDEAAGAGAGLRLALACGRPHRYEGWSDHELQAPVRELAVAGVRRFVFTNSCGSLRPAVRPGDMVACREVVDLQPPPRVRPERLAVCAEMQCRAVTAAVRGTTGAARSRAADRWPASAGARTAHTGVYVAVAGPQFETPAEVEWLAGYGDVVGMSGTPEARAAAAAGAESCLLGLVANRAAAIGSHEDVLAVGAALADVLAAALPAVVTARWPDTTARTRQGAPWTS